jgi:hypothetical protein
MDLPRNLGLSQLAEDLRSAVSVGSETPAERGRAFFRFAQACRSEVMIGFSPGIDFAKRSHLANSIPNLWDFRYRSPDGGDAQKNGFAYDWTSSRGLAPALDLKRGFPKKVSHA